VKKAILIVALLLAGVVGLGQAGATPVVKHPEPFVYAFCQGNHGLLVRVQAPSPVTFTLSHGAETYTKVGQNTSADYYEAVFYWLTKDTNYKVTIEYGETIYYSFARTTDSCQTFCPGDNAQGNWTGVDGVCPPKVTTTSTTSTTSTTTTTAAPPAQPEVLSSTAVAATPVPMLPRFTG